MTYAFFSINVKDLRVTATAASDASVEHINCMPSSAAVTNACSTSSFGKDLQQ